MDKILQLDDRFYGTGEPTLMVVGHSIHGRWITEKAASFRREGVVAKYASPAFDYIQNVQPRDGHTFVLVNALGAYETWDANRNGDGFPEKAYKVGQLPKCGDKQCLPPTSKGWLSEEETLLHHYKTFETHGGIYKHHCFPAGTSVVLADRTRTPIEDVRVGDLIATHDGNHPVTQTLRRAYTGPGVVLRFRGQLDELVTTDDHPILVLRRDQVHCRHGYNRLSPSPHVSSCLEAQVPVSSPTWTRAAEIQAGDYVLIRPPHHGATTIEPAFAALVGWVASEGHLGTHGSIQFTFASGNAADLHAVKTCFAELGVHVTITPRPQYGTVMLTACATALHARLARYVTGTLTEKRLTVEVLEWNRDALLHLFGAYVDGDGHVAREGRNHGQLRIRSSSRVMLHSLADVVRALGAPATLNWDTPSGTMVSPTNHQTYATSGSGCLAVTPNHVQALVAYSRKTSTRKVEGVSRAFTYESYHLVQVTERDDLFLDEDVYNLEVEGPHTFIASEVVVHNCNKDAGRSLGRVERAFWNPEMHRVELLLDLVNEKDKELVQRINDLDFPAVSMGCRVRWDVCTICGHRAPTRAQYCEHAMLHLREILPETGELCAVLNPSPVFFDISMVFKPADRQGFMFKKVAEGVYVLSSANLGEHVAEIHQKQARIRKLSDIQKKLIGDMVSAKSGPDLPPDQEALIAGYKKDVLPDAMKDTPPASDKEIEALASYAIPEILATLAEKNATLSTGEIAQVFLRKLGFVTSTDFIDRVVALQPVLHEVIAQHPDLLNKLGEAFGLDHPRPCPALTKKLGSWLEKRATFGEWLQQQWHSPYTSLSGQTASFGPGYLHGAQEPPRTDLLTMTDPNTGQVYRTTRGAAMQADTTDAKALLGSAAMIGVPLFFGLGRFKALHGVLGTGLRAAGSAAVALPAAKWLTGSNRPYRNPTYVTDQGIPVSGGTEFKGAEYLESPLGMTALLNKCAFDYYERLHQIPSGSWQQALVEKIARQTPSSAFVRFLQDSSSLSEKAAWLASTTENPSHSDFDIPDIDLAHFSTRIGTLLTS